MKFFATKFALATSLVQVAFSQTLIQLACECDDCCDIDVFNSLTSSSFSFEQSAATLTSTFDGELYNAVIADSVETRLMNGILTFVSNDVAAIDCTSSKATVTSTDGAIRKTVSLTNDGDMTCKIDWYAQFQSPSDFERNDLTVFYYLKSLDGNDMNANVFVLIP